MSKMMRKYLIGLSIAIVIYAPVVSWLTIRKIIVPPELIDTMILFILASATIFYALRTSDIAEATKEQAEATRDQADASVKMAEEMVKQTVMSARPVIIQKAESEKQADGISLGNFSHFEIYNAGNGPAIEVEVSLLLQREPPYKSHNCQREGFLRAGDTPIEFYTTFPPDVADSTFYIVSEYQGILSYSPQPKWYQTWLPCRLSVSGAVISGKLEFREVSEEKRIGIFKSEFSNGSKPK